MGSGTTNIVADRLRRNSIGIEIVSEYLNMVKAQITPRQLFLFDEKENYGSSQSKWCGQICCRQHRSVPPETNFQPGYLEPEKVLRRKNPYLFKAKHVLTSEELVRGLVDAHISSNEETIFGDWMEGLAIFINHKVFGGWKSGIPGIDLEFDRLDSRYIVSIKSGPNWGNSSQIAKMKMDFKTAQRILRTGNSGLKIVCVNGCCYGQDHLPDKGDYFKFCGQKFWEFISGSSSLYTDIIEPLGHKAKERNDDFIVAYLQSHQFVYHRICQIVL